MREIKFRAWDNYTKRMDWPLSISLLHKYACELSWAHKIYATDIVLMQFTGVHDRNNNPIYEGDIIEGVDSFNNEINLYGDVRYFENLAWFGVVIGDIDTHLNFNDIENIKIIGNIYENPELIKDSTK